MGIVRPRLGQALADCLIQDGVVIRARAVVNHLDNNLAAGVPGREDDVAHRILSGPDAVFHVLLNAVIHGVAHNMHNGVANAVHNGLVHFCVLAL